MQLVGPSELADIRRELRRALGDKGKVSDRYVRGIAEDAGIEVHATLGGLPPDLRKLLDFHTLLEAEHALWTLDHMRREGRLDDCRRAARRAKEDAEWIARNPHVRTIVGQEHEEIALWFQIWLETPNVFPSWLDIRLASAAFAERFLL